MNRSYHVAWRRLPVAHAAIASALMLSVACRAPAPAAAVAVTQHEASVKPGINDPYRDAKVDEWVERFEGESREIYVHREAILAAAGVTPGMTVADVGAGTGLFTMMFADAVGPTGKVIAVDITPEFIDLIRQRAREQRRSNVQTVLCREDSVDLPENSVDLVFTSDTYHHFEYPVSTLASIHAALRPGGSLVIVDFERIPGQSREWVLNHVRAGRETVIAEVTAAGFELATDQPEDAFLEENYILRFVKRR